MLRKNQWLGWVGTWAIAATAAHGAGFVEDFSTDPLGGGRWAVLDGDAGRFVYDSASQSLRAHFDTGLPTARLVRELGATVNQASSFRYTVDFEILSEGFFWDPDGYAQIAFGLMNRSTTGPDRAGGNEALEKAYDILTFDYFPNISPFWGGPTLSPTLINSPSAAGYWGSFNFEAGRETRLNDAGELPLPLDTPLTAEVTYAYRGATGRATLRVLQNETPLAINRWGGADGDPPAWGGVDGDPTTISTTLDGVGFAHDAFGFLLWNDSWALTSSVIADVVFHRVEMKIGGSWADFDYDGDVDLADFTVFQSCFNGPNRPAPSGCVANVDADVDGDVDLTDFGAFQQCFNGPNRPPACE